MCGESFSPEGSAQARHVEGGEGEGAAGLRAPSPQLRIYLTIALTAVPRRCAPTGVHPG